ncbi:MAG: stage 0 sporulation family protein [Oscillospiraceae bacterium]|nr:stage 0 sporulation family protein [Oscillospiraceae bacterium]
MKEVVGVRFRGMGRSYYFDPLDLELSGGDQVIVETARGVECGEITFGRRLIDETEFAFQLKGILRIATDADKAVVTENRQKEREAYEVCNEKINNHNLKMKLIDIEFTFDKSKVIFYFTSDGRVDFRDLVKDLAAIYKTRIELRQIGVRDESKLLGGIAICGRSFCCSDFLFDFTPVSIKMAKEQGLSLNPIKISGNCGRLMCCLKYEEDVYDELLAITPKAGAIVQTPEGNGTVVEVGLISGLLKVRMSNLPDAPPKVFMREDIKVIRDAKNRRAQNTAPESAE